MTAQITIPMAKIRDFCRRWQIVEFSLFGSVLRDDFHPDSDVDVLVSFAEAAEWTLLDFVHMQDELRGILRRNVDLVTRRGLEDSRNYIRKKFILESAEVVYAAS